ncbi:MAG: hypothetical protein ACRC2T_03975 [Thermoguttaceae bacterium]
MLHEGALGFVDGTEPVTVERFSSNYKINIQNALRRSAKTQDQARIVSIIPVTWVTWHLPTPHSDLMPRIGDEIVDSTQKHWFISKIEESNFNKVLKCSAYSFAVSFGPDEYFDIFRRTITQTQSGSEGVTWNLITSGVAAKRTGSVFAENNLAAGSTSGKYEYSERCQLVVRGPCDLVIADRLRMVSGEYYKITRLKFPDWPNGWIEMDVLRIC